MREALRLPRHMKTSLDRKCYSKSFAAQTVLPVRPLCGVHPINTALIDWSPQHRAGFGHFRKIDCVDVQLCSLLSIHLTLCFIYCPFSLHPFISFFDLCSVSVKMFSTLLLDFIIKYTYSRAPYVLSAESDKLLNVQRENQLCSSHWILVLNCGSSKPAKAMQQPVCAAHRACYCGI